MKVIPVNTYRLVFKTIRMPQYTPIDFDPFSETKEIEKITPTNESQKEIWLACMFGGEEANLAYNESISLEFDGTFYIDEFKRALNNLVLRHEALRSTFSADGESLFTYRDFPLTLDLEDLSNSGVSKREELKDFISKALSVPLSLQEGPLFKVFLHKLGETKHVFTIIKHHAICDGWSSGIILEDLSKMYNAYIKGETIDLDKAWQLSDYVRNEQVFKASADYQRAEQYWVELYKGKAPVVDLPTDFPRTSPRSYKGMRLDFELDKAILGPVKVLAGKSGASLVTTLLAAFEVFLYTKTNQRDLVVGLPASGQAASGLTDVVGHCVNLLPIKAEIDPRLSFREYLKMRKGKILDAYENQRITFGELIKKLYIPRDSSRITLVPVIFNIDMGMDQAVSFDGLSHVLVSNPRAYETFDLFLNATGSKNKVVLEWSFNTGLFTPGTIKQFHEDFELLLQKIVSEPDLNLSTLNLAGTHSQKQQVVVTPMAKGFPNVDPAFESLNDLLDNTAERFPESVAVTFNDQHLNYRALRDASYQLALTLQDNGVTSGDIVAVSMDRSADMLVTLLAILRTGAVYIPLDPSYPVDRIEFMLEDSLAKFLLVSEKYSNHYRFDAVELVVEALKEASEMEHNKPFKRVLSADLAYILYTSGSTGKPKGVKISHGNLSNFLLSMLAQPGLGKDDKLLAITTISFDIAGLELFLPLIAGAEVIIADKASTRDGRTLTELLKTNEITIMQATPSTWQMLVDSGWQGSGNLKVLSGGEPLTSQLAAQLLTRCSELWNMYGPTETTVWSTLKRIKKEDKLITVGWPINNTQIYILNEQGQKVEEGLTGEICIGGEGVGQGYLNRPELTREKFLADPHSKVPGKLMYKTGDLGLLAAGGELHCLGRLDQQVKIRGHRVELGEIESILSEAPGMKQAIVVVNEGANQEKRLTAYVTLEEALLKDESLSWKDRWETLYDIGAETNKNEAVPDRNLDGTLLEYYENGKELAIQSEEWLRSSIARIKALNPKRIYEIGSGAGQILYELADDVDYYLATDYAQTAIHKLDETLRSNPEKWGHVQASVASADDFTAVGQQKFDLVLLHSVAQYFSDGEYLIDVIKKGVATIEGSGCFFIGDMQGKNSLEMCHAMDHLPNASDSNKLATFKEIISNRVRIDDELIADPAFFYGLKEVIPQITAVNVQLRKGKSLNETTKYHYDVWIFVGSEKKVVSPDITQQWHDQSLSDVEELLSVHPKSVVELKNIFNSRTAKDCKLLEIMHTAIDSRPLLDIKAEVDAITSGVHPDHFWELAEKMGFNAHVRWSTDGVDGRFDVIFIPSTLSEALPYSPYADNGQLNLSDYIKAPFFKDGINISKKLTDEWKAYANVLLPSFMVPQEFIGLDRFPLTPNGKIDRKRLPKPTVKQLEAESGVVEHLATENERLVATIWSEALGLVNLKATDDFFELGGHSLLAMKVMIAIEKQTGKRLPLATLFDNSTIAKMALQLDEDKPGTVWDCMVPIRVAGSKKPLFLVHGGGMNILMFKSLSNYFEEDQPIYGIQALGLSNDTEVPETIEEIVKKYIEEILLIDNEGPYTLAGYSLGGILVYEMARQLKALGKELTMVGVIDTYASTGEDLTETSQVLKKVKRQFNKVPFFTKSFLKYPTETLSYQRTILKRKLHGAINVDAIDLPFELSAYETAIYERYSHALSDYKLVPDDIEVTLFRAKKRLYFLDDNEYLGWKSYAKRGVNVWEVPGDHKTFLYPPHDKKLVRVIQSALDKTRAGKNG